MTLQTRIVNPAHCDAEPYGEFRLEDPRLGVLDLTAPGYVVSGFTIGHPSERPIVRGRALNDGLLDESSFLGGRAVSFAVRYETRVRRAQELEDALKAYMSPRRRPRLVWSRKGTPDDLRSLPVRGIDAPVTVDGSDYPVLVTSWLSASAYIEAPTDTCVVVASSEVDEAGRLYPLTFDREYPAQNPIGAFAALNAGNAPADWTAVVTVGASGTVVQPTFTVNGIAMSFDQNGGLTLTAGQTLVIDTRSRTVLLNNDPATPRLNRVNFLEWSWEDLQLQPGENLVSFRHSGTSTVAFASICWRSAWL